MKLCLMEMDERTRQSVVTVLSHGSDTPFEVAGCDSADIAVMDLDSASALPAFRSILERRPDMKGIGLTANSEVAHHDLVVLRKPVSPSRLIESIKLVVAGKEAKISVSSAGAAASLGGRKAVVRQRGDSAVSQTADEHFDPKNFLLGTILDAVSEAERRASVAVATFYGNRVIAADRKGGTIRTNLSAAQARAFALCAADGGSASEGGETISLRRPAIEYLAPSEVEVKFGTTTECVPWENFMWALGAATSRGRLPTGITAGDRVYLRRWPNLTRLSHTNNDIRIIAYWAQQATSMDEIAQALDIPPRDVFKVYSAAYAAGLAGPSSREVDRIWEAPPVVEHQQRSVFSSVLSRLLQRKPVVQEQMLEVAA